MLSSRRIAAHNSTHAYYEKCKYASIDHIVNEYAHNLDFVNYVNNNAINIAIKYNRADLLEWMLNIMTTITPQEVLVAIDKEYVQQDCMIILHRYQLLDNQTIDRIFIYGNVTQSEWLIYNGYKPSVDLRDQLLAILDYKKLSWYNNHLLAN